MKNRKIDIFTKDGTGCNEDEAWLSPTGNCGFVIDGASGLFKEKITSAGSDAQWFAQTWCEYLKKNLPSRLTSLEEIIEQGIREITAEFMAHTGAEEIKSKPSAGIAIFRIEGDTIRTFVLGDCSIMVINHDGGYLHLLDSKLSDFDEINIKRMVRIAKEKGINVIEARSFVKEDLVSVRNMQNTPNGYWALAFDVNAVTHANKNEINLSKVKSIIAMTDGFSQIVDLLGMMTKEEFAKRIIDGSTLEQFFDLIRQAQEGDPFCNRFPRFKKSDDATAVSVHFGGEQ